MRKATAIPGGAGANGGGAWLQRTASGYKNEKQRSSVPAGQTSGEIPNYDGAERTITGTSIFDPVLCELVYRWFCPPGGRILDPFAGGSVRGIVASKLGRSYRGIDLSERQIAANRVQAKTICRKPLPVWTVGDARAIASLAPGPFDFIFSCPPYADLEVYSDDPLDLSTLDYREFRKAYRQIIAEACDQLAPDRFACFVVGDARDDAGMYYGLPSDTVQAFEAAGLRLYNDAILVTAVGSLPVRTRRQFEVGRKLGKTHQNVLVFVKGDPRAATKTIGKVQFGLGDDLTESETAGETVSVKVSAACARLMFIECGPSCIAAGCKGNCCDAPSRATGCMVTIHPSEQTALEARGAVVCDGLLQPSPGLKGCPFKRAGLCNLHGTPDKPFGCIASPFTLNSSDTLIVRNRYKMLPCYRNSGPKAPAYVAFRSSLDLLLGTVESARLVQHLDAGGGDLVVEMHADAYRMLVDNDAIKKGAS